MIDDLDRIMDVMANAFDPHWGEAWTRRQISDSLALPHTLYRLIDAQGRIPIGQTPAAGFTLTRCAPGEEELLLIAIGPEYRGKGLGKILLDHFITDAGDRGAERILLEMRANNPAEKLYRAAGFEQVGKREKYYTTATGGKVDAITFARDL